MAYLIKGVAMGSMKFKARKTTYSVVFGLFISMTVMAPQMAVANWEKIPSSDFQLPPPPDKDESALEIDELLALQSTRTKAECDLGEKQAQPSFKKLFSGTGLLTSQEIKTLEPLMEKVSHLGERVAGHFKSRYRRTRPYNFDSRIQPCVTPPGGSKSYPSSHATVSTLDACVLTGVFPAYTNDFTDLGTNLSERRMRIGVHFPSDVRAGRSLADAICKRLQAEPDFMHDLEQIKRAL